MKRFLSIFIIGFCLLSFQAYSVEKMPFKPRWVSILKKGKFFKYKRREFSSPVIFEDGLYIGTDTGLFYRFNKDGDKVWRIKNGAPINSTALAIRSGDLVVVFYGDDEGFLHALNAQDGKELWQINLGSEIWSAPTFSNSSKAAYVFVSTMEGKVFCINPIDGHIVWEKEYTFPRPVSEFGDMAIRGTSDPVVDESRVYVGFADGTFWALSQNDGKVLWEKNLATQKGFNDVDGPVLLDGDRLYVSSFEGNLTAFSRKDGKSLWTKEIGTAVKMLMVEEGGERKLFVSGTDATLYHMNPKTGDVVWKTLVGKGSLTSPIYYKGVLAVGLSSGPMNFINANTGKLIIRRFAKKGIFSNPILDEDKIYYLSNGGRLYSLRFKIK